MTSLFSLTFFFFHRERLSGRAGNFANVSGIIVDYFSCCSFIVMIFFFFVFFVFIGFYSLVVFFVCFTRRDAGERDRKTPENRPVTRVTPDRRRFTENFPSANNLRVVDDVSVVFTRHRL